MIMFIVFVVVVAFVLLGLSILLSPHVPYSQKLAPFECGFDSFRGQNRTEFSISFFLFGLLFLLFDLEILLVYPYTVSSYNNSYYGLTIVILFLLLLTVGFVAEFGKGALQINSKQTGYLTSSNVKVKERENSGNLYTRHTITGCGHCTKRSFSTVRAYSTIKPQPSPEFLGKPHVVQLKISEEK